MKRKEYLKRLEDAYAAGRISEEAYDAGIMNADIFCDDDEDDCMKTTVYRYYCRFCPPMPGAIPRLGLARAFSYDYKQSIGGVGAWGFAEYDRPLTAQEIEDYELAEGHNNPLEYD